MKLIPLTQGKFAIVDNEDYIYLSKLKWHIQKVKGLIYAKNCVYLGGGRNNQRSENTFMHRLIMGASKGQQIDHINGNGLDNRKCNLRFCTQMGNNRNARCRTPKSSKFKGVCVQNRIKKPWQASITVDYKQRWLGSYATQEEAAKAYDAAARKYYGEFACPNFS